MMTITWVVYIESSASYSVKIWTTNEMDCHFNDLVLGGHLLKTFQDSHSNAAMPLLKLLMIPFVYISPIPVVHFYLVK